MFGEFTKTNLDKELDMIIKKLKENKFDFSNRLDWNGTIE